MDDRHERSKAAAAGCFRRSKWVGMGERFFTFLFTLSCGYAASYMLDMAMCQEREGLFRAGTLLMLLLAAGLPTAWLLSKWAARVRTLDRQRFREELYRRMLGNRLEIASFGEQTELLGDISDQIAEQYQTRLPQTVEGLCIILGATALMCRERLSIGILFLLMGLVQVLPVFTYQRWTRKIYESAWDSDEAETDWIVQGMDGLRTLKAYGREEWFVKRYHAVNRRGIKVGNKAVITGGLESILYAAISALLRYGSYGVLGLYVLYAELPAASLPVLIVLGSYVFSSMDKLFTFLRYRIVYRSALERLEEALAPKRDTGGEAVLKAENISKAFDGKQVLRDVSLTINNGERVLLRGGNGSGKSTLIRILIGELAPDCGSVRIGSKLAAALQEDPMLSIPARAFLNELEKQPDWHIESFMAHLKAFRFSKELLDKPTQELSGGQRRKLFLAVALAREAELLILDEPTNHLDADSRAYLQETLMRRRCAMLICTHDTAFSLPWDRTLCLKGGGERG